jgi:hypothetical protein
MNLEERLYSHLSSYKIPGLIEEIKENQKKSEEEKDDEQIVEKGIQIEDFDESSHDVNSYARVTNRDRLLRGYHEKLHTVEGLENIKTYNNLKFQNWGETVSNKPCLTFYPQSILDIQKIVNWSRLHGKRVRCAGYRHTWINAYSDDNQVLIIMIPLKQSSSPPSDPIDNPKNELLQIELIDNLENNYGTFLRNKEHLIKVGASVTNEQLRSWCVKNKICISSNVIMREITLGGSNAPICHGSGINEQTLSDLVYGMEIVNSMGEVVKFNRKTHSDKIMNVIAGSFGLFGVTVSLTLKAKPMKYALLDLKFEPNEIAVPPVNVEDGVVYDKFRERIVKMRYNEFFWFPYQDQTYVNCWYDTTDDKNVVEYPSKIDSHIQEVQTLVSGICDTSIFKMLPSHTRTEIFGSLTKFVLPEDKKVKTYLSDAEHFRAGIHNKKVRDFEMEVPLEKSMKYKGEPDLKPVQAIWYDLIKIINDLKSKNQAPISVGIEMRITSGSDIIMAPQHGNDYTLAIEVLTDMSTPYEEWVEFCTLIMPIFDRYIYKSSKPHWAKDWQNVKKGSQIGIDWVKPLYKNSIKEFKKQHQKLNMDPNHMFSNEMFDKLFDFKFSMDLNANVNTIPFNNEDKEDKISGCQSCCSCFGYFIKKSCCC